MVPRTERRAPRRQPRRAEIRRARRRRRGFALLAVLVVAIVAAFSVFLLAPDDGADDAPALAEKPVVPTKGALLLNENFKGDALDPTRWSPCYHWTTSGCTNLANNELEWYVPEQVKVADGVLSLEAKPQTVTGHEGRQFDFVSGLISGASPDGDLFAFQYGYVESRVWLPKGQGLWPALWMLPTTRESSPEVDIFEAVGEEPKVIQMHTHYTASNGEELNRGSKWHGPDMTKGWHTFGLDWKPDSLTWYIDGAPAFKVTETEQIPHEPMYLITNLAVGGDFTKAPDASTPFPSSLKVDYIRVWRNE